MNFSAPKSLSRASQPLRWFSMWKGFFVALILIGTMCGWLAIRFYRSLPSVSEIGSKRAVSSKILDRNGNLLYEIHGEAKRTPVALADISPHLREATITVEDRKFYSHPGIELPALIRAFWKNTQAHTTVQGGSTITQQLVKNTLLSNEKTYQRKLKEAALALKVEREYSKDQILEMYLNQIPYGRNAYGAEAASQTYFGKAAKDLDLAESAYLAALPKAPSLFSPFGPNRDYLDQRKNYILGEMKKLGYVTDSELNAARQEAVTFRPAKTKIAAPHFVEYVLQDLEQQYGREFLEEAGWNVYTTLDLPLQQQAEQIVKEGADKNRVRGAYNAALVAIEPATGEIITMVGSRDYFGDPEPPGCRPGVNCLFDPQTNIALAERQPGSSFKPYTYLTAFSPEHKFTPSSMILDSTTNFAAPGTRAYIPHDYDGKERGWLTMRKALSGSLNIPAVRTLSMVGVQNVVDTAHHLGINSPLSGCGLSLTLGACEVRLLDHVYAYAVVANGGKKAQLRSVLKISSVDGKSITTIPDPPQQAVNEEAVYLVTNVLSDPTARNFIFGSHSPLTLPDRPVAAKTGTTQNFKDGWTMGYTPQLAVGVWAGNNDGTPLKWKSDGVFVAAPIWQKFMIAAHQNVPVAQFTRPSGIVERPVDPNTGRVVSDDTPGSTREVFASYSAPAEHLSANPQPWKVTIQNFPDSPARN